MTEHYFTLQSLADAFGGPTSFQIEKRGSLLVAEFNGGKIISYGIRVMSPSFVTMIPYQGEPNYVLTIGGALQTAMDAASGRHAMILLNHENFPVVRAAQGFMPEGLEHVVHGVHVDRNKPFVKIDHNGREMYVPRSHLE